MRFWLTDGVFHREGTVVTSKYEEDYGWYPDTGVAFDIPEGADSVTIPEGTRVIGRNAFYKFGDSLRKVIIPEGVEMIGAEAFGYCKNLEDVSFPLGLKKVGFMAFIGTGLKSVVLPESLEAIDGDCFDYCKKLEEIIFPDKPIKMGNFQQNVLLFSYCKALKRVVLPSDCKYMVGFAGCELIKEVSIPDGTEEIIGGYFRDCKSLRSVTIPETVTQIGQEAFINCVQLTEIVLHNKIKSIGADAFKGCSGLEHIVAKMPLKGSEKAFKNLTTVKRADVTQSSISIAKQLFPDAEIYDLKGKLAHSPGNEGDSQPAAKTVAVKKPTKTPAVKYHPGTKIEKLSKVEYDVNAGSQAFHVTFKGTTTFNKAVGEHLEIANGKTSVKMYDPRELLKVNAYSLHRIDVHTGVTITTLSEAYENLGETRIYSDPLTEVQIMRRMASFVSDVVKCLRPENVAKLLELSPKKKNGTLYKGRVTMIRKCACADSEGNVLALYAKNMSDTDMDIAVKKVFIGEDAFSTKEAASEAGIV